MASSPKPKAAKSPAPEAAAHEAPATVEVTVLCAALGEDGSTYLKGETFRTTPARAAALGDSVAVL